MKKLLFLAGLCAALTAARAAETFPLPSKWVVETPAQPTRGEQFAKAELEKYLGALPAGGEERAYHISLSGRGVKTSEGRQPDARAGDDVYRVTTNRDTTALTGINDRAVIYAAYDLLEQFGYRWLMPGPLGEIAATSRDLPVQDRLERPAFTVREICSSGGEKWSQQDMVAWEIRNRLNRDFNLRRDPLWAERGGFPLWQWIAHNYVFILPPQEYFEKHPDWFALYKGKRVPLGTEQGNLCTTSPEVIAHFAKFINEWFDAHPEGSVFPLSPPDGAIRWCECERCQALGGRNFTPGPEGSMSLRQIRFVKAIAEIVGKTHPDRKVLLLAYQNYVDPVPGEKLPENVLVQVVNYGAFGQPMTAAVNRTQMERFRGWAQVAAPGNGSPGVWDYSLLQIENLSGSHLMPVPVASALHDNLNFINGLGGRVYFTQAGPLQESNPFLFYAAARWTWNPALSFDAVLGEFCDRFYGPAAAPMKQYWTLLENAAHQSGWNPAVWPAITTPDARLFTPAVLGEAARLLDAAKAAAQSPKEQERVALIRRSLDFVTLSVSQAKPWRVVRGEKAYRMNVDGGAEAERQVKGLKAELKNSTDPNGSLQRLIYRLRPREISVETLQGESARVAVIPELGGRIIRFVDAKTGWNFLDEPEGDLVLDNPGAAYVHYGGYEEYADAAFAAPGWEVPFQYGKQGTSLKLVGHIGERELGRKVTLDPMLPALRIESELSPAATNGVLRSHPVLRLPDPMDQLVLVWKNAQGTFSRQSIAESAPGDIKGAWGVFSPKLQALILHRFEPGAASPRLHVDREKGTFNLELASLPGRAPALKQEFRIFHGSLEETLKAVNAPSPTPNL